ncbi:hypothetical protein [Aureimonas sp. AU12]|uniref:hypothetical protein n=1 Tax=Aureimonas sp. AU12 TaxID=1638161 RepID=UPI0007829066|nr:hypothetical protein [Aureimonas sp. AU12]
MKATGHALMVAAGGCTAAQIILGHKSPSTISAQASMSEPDRWMNVRDVMTLEYHVQEPIVSRWMVDRHSADARRVFAPIDDGSIMHFVRECGEAKLALIASHERRRCDGTYSAADRALTIRELRELEEGARDLRERLEAQL